jgi:hypothetical protein
MVEIKHNAKLPGNDDFILAHQVKQVYYLKYPCEKLTAWQVVYKVNPCEQLYTPTNSAYHFDDEHVDEIYQEEELPTSFIVEPGVALRFLSWRWCSMITNLFANMLFLYYFDAQ